MKKVLVWGNGFIGSYLKYNKIQERATTNANDMKIVLDVYKPDVVINCMGFCGGKNVDGCEFDKQKTIESNVIIPSLLAAECQKKSIQLIHLASGCIFYGWSKNVKVSLSGPEEMGWMEGDEPNLTEASFYSKTKYAADLLLKPLGATILRLRMPISSDPSPRNLITKLLNYKQVLVEPNSMTFVDDLARAIDWFIETRKTGIYHVANPEPMTHDIILDEYKKYVPSHQYEKITAKQLDTMTVAKRSNCILDTTKLQSEGFSMTPTMDALKKTIKDYVKNMEIK